MKVDLSNVKADSEIAKECMRLHKLRQAGTLSQSDLDTEVALLAHKHKDIYYYKNAPVKPDSAKDAKSDAFDDYMRVARKHQGQMSSNAIWLERWVEKLFKSGNKTQGEELLEVLDTYPVKIGEWERKYYREEKRSVGIKVTERDPIVKKAEELFDGKITREQKEFKL